MLVLLGSGCRRPPVAPEPSRPPDEVECLAPTGPAEVAAALRDELLAQREGHPELGGLASTTIPVDGSPWSIAYGHTEVANERYDEQLQAYQREHERRRDAEASGPPQHRPPLSPPSKTTTVLGPDGFELWCRFTTTDPRDQWAHAERTIITAPVAGGDVADLQAVVGAPFAHRLVRIGDTFVAYSASTEIVTASLLTLAHRVAACGS